MPKKQAMTYQATGVNYDSLDTFKRACQKRAAQTSHNAERLGVEPVEESRGESVYLIKNNQEYFGHVEEGLGTKNLIADSIRSQSQKSYYDHIAQDTVAMIVNDMATLGIMPVTLAMHLGVGSSDWFKDEQRIQDLVSGWGAACDLARCIWSGGETPALKGIILPEAALLSGSAFGKAKEGRVINASSITAGDAIVFIESSGVHANGLTLARSIAETLPQRYMTKLLDGRTYGEVLLDPTHIYVGLMEDCLECGVQIHYAVNITGHGWRKLMRAPQPLAYIVEELPTQLPIFDFIQTHGPVEEREMYGNFNMGVGFALYIPESDVPSVIKIAQGLGLRAFRAGHIEQSAEKKVVIKPKQLEYTGSTLQVR